MARLGRFTEPLWDLDTSYVFDDFCGDQTDLYFVDTIPDTGTALVGDGQSGIMTLLPSDGSVGDNDEVYLSSANELFLHASNKPIYGRCLLQFTEGNTDDLNVVFGFMNAVTAQNAMLDDGAGPKASGSSSVIYKVDGGTVWRANSRNSTDYTDTISTTAGGTAYQLLEILIEHYTALLAQVTYKVDGLFLKDTYGSVIRHTVPYASATEMVVFVGAKNGGAGTVETLLVDYIYGQQLRIG